MKKFTFYFQTKGLQTKLNQMERADKFLPGPDKYLFWKTEENVAKLLTLTFAYFLSMCYLFYGQNAAMS
jgi:hypothetical protein